MPGFPSPRSCEALFHTLSEASAAPQTERYRKIVQCVGPYHPSDVLYDHHPRLCALLLEAISEGGKNSGDLLSRATLGRPLSCVDKVRGGKMRKLFGFFFLVSFIHSFCSEDVFALVVVQNRRISSMKTGTFFFPPTTLPHCAALGVMLSHCACFFFFNVSITFPIITDTWRDYVIHLSKVYRLRPPPPLAVVSDHDEAKGVKYPVSLIHASGRNNVCKKKKKKMHLERTTCRNFLLYCFIIITIILTLEAKDKSELPLVGPGSSYDQQNMCHQIILWALRCLSEALQGCRPLMAAGALSLTALSICSMCLTQPPWKFWFRCCMWFCTDSTATAHPHPDWMCDLGPLKTLPQVAASDITSVNYSLH